jgi:AsmA family.
MKKFFFWLKYALLAFTAFVIIVFAIAYLQKDELVQRLKVQLEKNLHGELEITKLNFTIFHRFPDFSFTLRGVSLRDTVFHQPILSAEKVYLDIGLYELVKKEINIRSLTLEDARLFLFKTRNGNTNIEMFKGTADSISHEKKTPYLLSFSKFELRNTEFTYADSSTGKFTQINFRKTKHTLQLDDSVYKMTTKGELYFSVLFDNDSTGGYLINKSAQANLTILFGPSFQKIQIEESPLEFEKTKLLIAGELETKKGGAYRLHFQGIRSTCRRRCLTQ